MSAQNALQTKEKIISVLKNRGPMLPVHIAKEVEMSILFTSAFLSELLSEKRIMMSNMRVGSSPIYFLSGQEPLLEGFAENLKSKEREAFLFLKEKIFFPDSLLEPAIRVAIRSIKDFAIPFRENDETIWKYFTADESDFKPQKKEREKQLEILDNTESVETKKKEPVKEKGKTKKASAKKAKKNEKFLERVKEFLSKSSVEILNIEVLKKDELILRIKINGKEQLLSAYNKKKIGDREIIRASKKASELGLKYSVLSLGELPKKVSELIAALKDIEEISRIE